MNTTGYICVYTCIFQYANNNNEKRHHAFEREYGGLYGRNWREESEGRNDVSLLKYQK